MDTPKTSEELKEIHTNEEIAKQLKTLPSPSLQSKLLAVNAYRNEYKEMTKKMDNDKKDISKRCNVAVSENFNKIRAIINGEVAPEGEGEAEKVPLKYFWRTALVNSNYFDINEKDKDILNHLTDLRIVNGEFPNFTIEFVFEKNDYFDKEVLSKEFIYEKDSMDKGKETKGTEIEWKSDEKNPTKKIVVKVIKKKKTRETVTKEKEVASFFDIFNVSKTFKKDRMGLDASEQADFFKNDFLPNCLEYYLNILEINYDEDPEEEEDDE